jgi:hypothetical protein
MTKHQMHTPSRKKRPSTWNPDNGSDKGRTKGPEHHRPDKTKPDRAQLIDERPSTSSDAVDT